MVTVQARTVEEATEQALELIGLAREDVHVEVLSNPGRRLMGLRKVMAEVMVTQIEEKAEEELPPNKALDFEQMIDEMMTGEKPPVNLDSQKESIPSATQSDTGARIYNGEIEFVFGEEQYPVIEPSSNVLLYVNEEQKTDKTMILPSDQVNITLCDELVLPNFSIKLIEQEMIALLTFTPGKRVIRALADTDFKTHLRIEVKEEIEYYNDLQPQQIVDELKAMGVQQGLLFPAIKKVIGVNKPYELIVAKGTLPVEGADGDLEVHINYEEFDPDSLEQVDFREMNVITNVIEGQVIATHILPVPGTEGRSLLGKSIPVKPVRDVVLRLGKNVEMVEQNVVATISGKPALDWREKLVKVEVNHEFHHPGEVDLESGNIRFEGDVRIGGNVLPSMFVGATGSIDVGGSVTKATVHAVKSAMIRGNVLSSTISVGKQEVVISELVGRLKDVVTLLDQIKEAVEQIFLIRGDAEDELSPSELKRLIYLLLEKKYSHFETLNKDFIQSVRKHAEQLTPEWSAIADKLYNIFVTPLNEELEGMAGFELLIEEAKVLVELYGFEVSPQTQLILPYAINSVLYSNGNIEITSKGVYQSTLTAEGNVTIRGVCRGGEIIAQNEVTLQETGSESPVKTVVKTSAAGRIKIGKAYVGTEIQVGMRKHSFSRDELDINARLDEEGELLLR